MEYFEWEDDNGCLSLDAVDMVAVEQAESAYLTGVGYVNPLLLWCQYLALVHQAGELFVHGDRRTAELFDGLAGLLAQMLNNLHDAGHDLALPKKSV